MTDSHKPKKDEPKAVTLTVSKAADFKNRKRSGITLAEYKELSAKDRAALTPREKKQLEEAQQHLKIMAETLASKYDFSAITQSIQSIYKISPAFQTLQTIDTSPLLKIVADMQKTTLAMQPALDRAFGIQAAVAPALEAIYKSTLFTQNQFAALAAVQKSLVKFPTENIIATIKSIQDAFQAPLIARTLFADIHTKHERVIRGLQFDLGSLTTNIEFSRFETVDFALDGVVTDDDNLIANAVATQTNTVGNITLSENANFMLEFNDLRQDVRELKQQLIAKDIQQGQFLVAPSQVNFQRIGSSMQIQLGTLRVTVTISSSYTKLARFLLSSPENIVEKWHVEDLAREIYGAHFANNADEDEWKNKIKGYAHHFNQQVMIASGGKMPKFIDNDGFKFFINPDYLNL